MVAGSLRRRKAEVGDLEILFLPKLEQSLSLKQGDLLSATPATLVDVASEQIDHLVSSGIIRKRNNSLGSEIWGGKNKLARHIASGIPVDFFTTSAAGWWSLVVCRTGGKRNNIDLATAAQKKFWRWSPYEGFWDREGKMIRAESEEDVYRLLGQPWLDPWKRL